MPNRYEVFKCEICGNIVEVIHGGKGQLVCCNQPMNLLDERNEDTGGEKHVPIVEINGDEVTINVGSVQHPMEDEHFIEFVEVIYDNKVCRKYLNAPESPKATFKIDGTIDKVREYCTKHGLWSAK